MVNMAIACTCFYSMGHSPGHVKDQVMIKLIGLAHNNSYTLLERQKAKFIYQGCIDFTFWESYSLWSIAAKAFQYLKHVPAEHPCHFLPYLCTEVLGCVRLLYLLRVSSNYPRLFLNYKCSEWGGT